MYRRMVDRHLQIHPSLSLAEKAFRVDMPMASYTRPDHRIEPRVLVS